MAGPFQGGTTHIDGALSVDGRHIPFHSVPDPAQLPWRAADIDLVIEATGIFTSRAQAARHIEAGAGGVIITAPSPEVT